MTSKHDIAVLNSAAELLRTARARRSPIAPISASHDIRDVDAAYAVAEINAQARLLEGRRVVGKKVGLTSVAVQQQLGVDQPDFGMLFDDMEYRCGSEVPMSALMQPRIEAEVAFVVGRDLNGMEPSYPEFLMCLEYVLPALEIVDSAIAGWRIAIVDTIADNASCGLYVLGDEPLLVGQMSLAEAGMSMAVNGQTASVGSSAACLGHPLRAAYWLACTMARRGTGLHAGDVILSGALGPMVPVSSGDLIDARIGALGSVRCRMV
ncbi:2-hydroxypentadienoate hydratase [Burkholderia multivorans]